MKSQNDGSHHTDLLEVVRGYSLLKYLDKSYYFKHFTVIDALEVEDLRIQDLACSEKSGIKTEKQLIESAINIGAWSNKQEEKIKSTEWTIKRSTVALGKIKDITQRKTFNEQIKKQEEELAKIKGERAQITRYSAEHLAETKRVSRMVDRSAFCDLNFKKPVPDKVKLSVTGLLFARYAELNSRDNILRASYHGGFFDAFICQKENPFRMFNCTFAELTVFQKYLMVLSNNLFSKLKNNKMPEEIMGDPVKMIEYEEKDEEDKSVSHGVDDLKMKMQARGGKLKAEDFLT